MDHAACLVAFVVPRPRLHLRDSRLYFGGWVCGEGPARTRRRRNKTPFCLGPVPAAPRLNAALERISMTW